MSQLSKKTPRGSLPGVRNTAFGLTAAAAAVFVFSVALLLTDEAEFFHWIREDGPVEWATFAVLLAAACWALLVRSSYRRQPDGRRGSRVWLAIALICLFGALEEISYGQRILGIQTPEFLLPPDSPGTDAFYNRQAETNLHNLMIFGVNINKVIFGQLLALAMMLCIVVAPLVYRRNTRFAGFIDRSGLPMARTYQIVVYVAVAVCTTVLRHLAGKISEAQEFAGSTLFLVLLLHSRNIIARPDLPRAWARLKERLAAFIPHGPKLRLILAVVGLQLILCTAFRIAFLLTFRSTAGDLASGDVLRAFYLGLKFDVRLALLICLPFVVVSWIRFLNPARSGIARGFWWTYFVVVEFLILFLYFVDLGHYGYLHTRLNVSILDHVLSTGIALGMVRETYPVIPGLLAIGLLSTGFAELVRRLALRHPPGQVRSTTRLRRVLGIVALVALYALGIYGKWSWYPLRWSDAFFGPNTFVSALGLNPVLFLYDTTAARNETYDLDKVRASYDVTAGLLEVGVRDPAKLSFARRGEPREHPPFRPNLVLIHLEAFAGHKTSALGNPLDSSPELDGIARDSILFTNFFVPTAPTARSVFAMVTGIPDVSHMRSASRNPGVVNQHTLINALEGYRRFYFLGGSATWANIRGLLAHNIPELQIYEEGDYDAPRVNVWGVSDLDLFEKAHEVLRSQSEPFFAFIQTAGNHGPYTIPENRRGFELVDVDDETVQENGFPSPEAYNSFRLLDYSLGYFFRLAREDPYFERTLFVMYGDHGIPAPRAIPWERLGLTSHHVPLVIHAPWRIDQGRRIDSVASLVDVLPTCLSLMGVPYTNTTLGRDLLTPRPAERHFAFIDHGLLTDEYLLSVDPLGRSRLYAYRSETAAADIQESLPEETVRLREVHDAILETSRYLLYNNAAVNSDSRASAAHAVPGTRD